MKTKLISLVIFPFIVFSVIGIQEIARAQAGHPSIDRASYKAAIEAELSRSPRDRYLYEHADAYSRLVQIRALRRLGYDLTDAELDLPLLQDSNLSDTVENVTRSLGGDQNETTIAINRANTKIIVAGANDSHMYTSGMPSYTSTDQGRSWNTHNHVPLPPAIEFNAYEAYGDPALAVDDSGYFYYAYLAGDNSFQFDNVLVATSKDGKIWKNGGYIVPTADIAGFEDKEQIAVDQNPKSPYYGRVYVAWVHFDELTGNPTGGARIAWSDDRCHTWSTIVTVTEEIIEFAEIKTGVNGEVILTFSSVDGETGGLGIHEMYVSKDGGLTFTPSTFATYMGYPVNDFSRPGLKGSAGFRCYPYIAEDIDLKSNKIHLVYGTWNSNDSDNPAAVLYYVTSTDVGMTWSVPKPVGISNPEHSSLGFDRFCPWVSVDQKTGDAYAVYYSSEGDVDNQLVSVYRAKLNGGLTEYPRLIGDREFDPTLISQGNGVPPFIGDYIGSDVFDSVYAAAWTENRLSGRDGDVFVYVSTTKSASHPVTGVNTPVVVSSKNLWLSAPSPNPVTSGILSFNYYLPSSAVGEIALYSSTGIKVRTFANEKFESGTYSKEYELAGLPSGKYILRLQTNYGSVEMSVVVTN